MNRLKSDKVFAPRFSTKRRISNNDAPAPRLSATPPSASNAQECLLIAATPNDKNHRLLVGCDHKTDNTHREVAAVPYGRC